MLEQGTTVDRDRCWRAYEKMAAINFWDGAFTAGWYEIIGRFRLSGEFEPRGLVG